MKYITLGGFIVEEFKKLDKPLKRGILKPHIYEGYILNCNDKERQYCTWDDLGRCGNFSREDCFINIASMNV